MKEVFKKKGKKAPSLARCALSSSYLKCAFALGFKEMSFGKKGVFCLQSTQTQTFSLVTCLARASGLQGNSITATGLRKPPGSRAVGQRRSDSSRLGRGRGRSGVQPGLRPGPRRSWDKGHRRGERGAAGEGAVRHRLGASEFPSRKAESVLLPSAPSLPSPTDRTGEIYLGTMSWDVFSLPSVPFMALADVRRACLCAVLCSLVLLATDRQSCQMDRVWLHNPVNKGETLKSESKEENPNCKSVGKQQIASLTCQDHLKAGSQF